MVFPARAGVILYDGVPVVDRFPNSDISQEYIKIADYIIKI